ncbi:MAG TPA: TonB-dependent receptor [Saprospiraceae bacterium]|nr:TonB-dependent receptor [Saprospiraceae bacterium]
MDKLFGIILLLILTISGYSQAILTGRITDADTEDPLSFSNIAIHMPDGKILGTSADLDGKYSLKLPFGKYKLVASYVGYQTVTEDVDVAKDVVVKDFALAPATDVMIIACPVVYASRPFTVDRIFQATIEKENLAQDVPFLLKMTPSAVVTSDAGAGVGYSGIRVRGADQTNINVTVNNIPLNDPESHQVYWVDLPDIMASAKNIEIERGVGTSTNGAGAFGATINVATKQPNENAGVTLASTIGSFNTQKYSLEANTGKVKDDFSFQGRVSSIGSDGYIDRASSDLVSYFLSANYEKGRHRVQLNTFSGHEITYQAWYGVPINYINDPKLRTYNAAGTNRPGSPYENQVDNYKQTHYQAIYDGFLSDRINYNLALHYTKGAGYYEQYKDGEKISKYGWQPLILGDTTIEKTDLIRRKWLDNDFYGAVFNLTIPIKNDKIQIGSAWNQYDGLHYGKVIWAQLSDIPKGHEYYNNSALKTDFNVFAKAYKNFGRFDTYYDLQFRQVDYRFEGVDSEGKTLPSTVQHQFWNPKVGVLYSSSSKWFDNTYASFAVAHREPNRNDYRSNSIDKAPKSERLLDFEAGVRKINGDFQYEVNGFYMAYKDQLVLTGKLTEVGEYARVNVPESMRMGVETKFAVKTTPWLTLSGNLTISQNKIKEFTEYVDNWDTWAQEEVIHRNTDLSFSPKVISGMAADFSILKNKLSASLTGKYVGKQYLDNTSNDKTALAAYFYNDLQINYLLKKAKVKYLLNLKVNNLFDQKYSTNGWAYRYRTGSPYIGPYDQLEGGDTYSQVGLFPQAGVNYLLGLVVKF